MATALLAMLSTSPPLGAQPPLAPPGAAGWTASPGHVAQFAPPSRREQYQAFVTAEPFDAVLRRLAAEAPPLVPGAWAPEALGVLDAFGDSGRYNRWTLARLFRGAPVRVARGPRQLDGRLEAWTLLSPYPDAGMSRLEPGTLLLVLQVPPL